MADKNSENKQWTDPKDYGLPFVEITPIRAKTEPVRTKSELPLSDHAILAETDSKSPISILSETKTLEETKEKTFESIIQILESSPIENKPLVEKKSSAWVWAVVLIGLGIVSVIVWQIQANMNSASSNPVAEVNETQQKELAPPVSDLTQETTLAEQNQGVVNQDSITSINNSNPNLSKPAETGTTIANVASGNLIRIESKTERPQYFIIVGSLPNEQLAIEEANQYFGKSPEIYLISPDEGGKNYRLGLSKFGSFRLAAEELERIKSQYSEELWILKY